MSTIADIKSGIDIVALIGQAVELKPSGRGFKGRCPFHHEKTPSFHVFPHTGTFKCFGCGKGGDAYTWYMEHERLTFREAVEQAARQAGLSLPDNWNMRQDSRPVVPEEVYRALRVAQAFYAEWLTRTPDVQAYLAGRGLSAEACAGLGIGYAPIRGLVNVLRQEGISEEHGIAAGVIARSERDGSLFDYLRDRVTISIVQDGALVGFGARAVRADQQPKFLNTPETVLFHKSAILYGLPWAEEAIQQQGAVVVEGYFDAITAHLAGYSNVVAQMGTALTPAQVKKLTRLTKTITMALDPDEAGQGAAFRSGAVARSLGDDHPLLKAKGALANEKRYNFELRIASLPDGLDPDDLIRADSARWEQALSESVYIVDFAIQRAARLATGLTSKQVAALAHEVVDLIDGIIDPVERSHQKARLAQALGVELIALSAPTPQQDSVRPAPHREEQKPLSVTIAAVQDNVLRMLIRQPNLLLRANRFLGIVLNPEWAGMEFNSRPLHWPPHPYLAPELTGEDFRAGDDHRAVFLSLRQAIDTFDNNGYGLAEQIADTLPALIPAACSTRYSAEIEAALSDIQNLREVPFRDVVEVLRLREQQIAWEVSLLTAYAARENTYDPLVTRQMAWLLRGWKLIYGQRRALWDTGGFLPPLDTCNGMW